MLPCVVCVHNFCLLYCTALGAFYCFGVCHPLFMPAWFLALSSFRLLLVSILGLMIRRRAVITRRSSISRTTQRMSSGRSCMARRMLFVSCSLAFAVVVGFLIHFPMPRSQVYSLVSLSATVRSRCASFFLIVVLVSD